MPHAVGWSQQPRCPQLPWFYTSAVLFMISGFHYNEGFWEVRGEVLGPDCASVIHTLTCVPVPEHP